MLSSMLPKQTSEFYCGKTGQAFDFKFGICVCEQIVCLVKKFDQNLKVSGLEKEVPLKLVKCF